MSQFAAHEQAAPPAASRTAELTPAPGLVPRRGTAQGFRDLKQKLKSPVSHLPTPAPEPVAEPAPPEISLDALEEGNRSSALPEGQEPQTDTHPFDLIALVETDEPPPMVDLSGIDKPPSGRLLLEGTIPSEALTLSEQDEPIAHPQAASRLEALRPEPIPHVPSDAKLADLKQLRLPSVPEVDEFALIDESPAPAESESASPEPEAPPDPAERPAADPQARAFWQKSEPDPEAEAEAEVPTEAEAHSQPVHVESEEAGDVARSLLEIMSLPANTTQPQERALAADSLLHLIHRLPLKTLVAMVERLSLMEAPPPLILAELIHDERIEVAGPLLEKCSAISDQDLLAVIADGRQHNNRMIARRRILASVICDALIATEEASAVLTLVRNPGAVVSHEAFFKLNEIARRNPSLQAPLATRADLPAPVAFELFWVLPAELRRYVISRFLTDSSTLNKILKLTQRMDEQDSSPRFASGEEIDRLFGLLTQGDRPAAEQLISALLGIAPLTVQRILSDAYGEPLAVACKALGASRADFERLLTGLKETTTAALRLPAVELQSFFETLSFNKARVLLTYWDWAVLRTGPYAGL